MPGGAYGRGHRALLHCKMCKMDPACCRTGVPAVLCCVAAIAPAATLTLVVHMGQQALWLVRLGGAVESGCGGATM
jgi:hypothetical protein